MIRICKAALDVLFENNGHVDFILDGIDFSCITFDSNQRKRYKEHLESATEAELRKIFRCVIQNPTLKKNVTFWKQGKEVSPPWEEEDNGKIKDSWRGYYEKQMSKKNTAAQKVCDIPDWSFVSLGQAMLQQESKACDESK